LFSLELLALPHRPRVFCNGQEFHRTTALTDRIFLTTQRSINHPQDAESLSVIGLLAHNFPYLITRRSKCCFGSGRIVRSALPSPQKRSEAFARSKE